MSTETNEWLNRNVLVGFTEKRGNAWHYRASDQGDEPNHYTGAIPIEDVRRRLFSWQALAVPMYVKGNDDRPMTVPNRVAIVRNDTYEVLGVPSASYKPHQYDDALLSNVEHVIDDNIQIGSAGLLKGGAVAWVQIEMPENLKVADVEFRPNLLATTSFNGSIATTYKRTVTIVVCDNTRAKALNEEGQEYRIRHTANSTFRLNDARDALGIVFQLGDEFSREIEQLLGTKVSDADFDKFLERLVPINDERNEAAKSRANNERDVYRSLWRDDERVARWRGNAFGAIQAVNTYRQHIKPTRGETLRVERTMLNTLTGVEGEADRLALDKLLAVVA